MTAQDTPQPAYRWVILALAFLVLLTSFSIRLALSNVAILLRDSLSLSATAVGAFVTAFYIGYVTANAVGGAIADRIGASRVTSLALASLAVFTFLFGSIGGAVSGLIVQVAMGLSAGVYFSATTKLVGAWFPLRERGRAFGIISMPSSLAVVLANTIYPLIVDLWSWETLYRVLGGYVAVVALLCFLFLRDLPTAQPKAVARAGTAISTGQAMKEMLKDRNFLLLAIGGFGGSWGTWGFAFWANALMVDGHGLSVVEAGRITAIFGIGALIAKPLYGLASDLLPVERKYMVVASYVTFAAMLLVFGLIRPEWLFIAAPILGVTAFVYSPIMSAILTEMIGQRAVGTAAGLMNAFWQTGSVVVPLVVGAVFQLTGSFMAAFAVLALGPAIGSLCMAAIKKTPEPSLRRAPPPPPLGGRRRKRTPRAHSD
ncbi:MAG: MFS transporter [Sphingomonadales bacterium]|nr:MFS transporter [Sphingomonadales bacterium]